MSYLDDVGTFLVKGPLYVEKSIDTGIAAMVSRAAESWGEVLPAAVARRCEKCGLQTQWRRDSHRRPLTSPASEPQSGNFEGVVFTCRNCGKGWFICYVRWTQEKNFFKYLKVGEFPEPEIAPPKALAKTLSSAEIGLYK